MLNNFDIGRGFVKQEDIKQVLDIFKVKAELKRDLASKSELARLEKELRNQLYFKLKIIFQRQIILEFKEAIQYYNANTDALYEKINYLYDIIDYINDDMNIVFIPDKLLVASYLRVNAQVFDMLMNDAQVEPNVQEAFKNLNEFIMAITQAGLENGVLNGYSWSRLQLKARFGGNEIEMHNMRSETTPLIITSNDIQRKLASDYDFTKLIADTTKDSKEESKK